MTPLRKAAVAAVILIGLVYLFERDSERAIVTQRVGCENCISGGRLLYGAEVRDIAPESARDCRLSSLS
jgi:hypothetical protein